LQAAAVSAEHEHCHRCGKHLAGFHSCRRNNSRIFN